MHFVKFDFLQLNLSLNPSCIFEAAAPTFHFITILQYAQCIDSVSQFKSSATYLFLPSTNKCFPSNRSEDGQLCFNSIAYFSTSLFSKNGGVARIVCRPRVTSGKGSSFGCDASRVETTYNCHSAPLLVLTTADHGPPNRKTALSELVRSLGY